MAENKTTFEIEEKITSNVAQETEKKTKAVKKNTKANQDNDKSTKDSTSSENKNTKARKDSAKKTQEQTEAIKANTKAKQENLDVTEKISKAERDRRVKETNASVRDKKADAEILRQQARNTEAEAKVVRAKSQAEVDRKRNIEYEEKTARKRANTAQKNLKINERDSETRAKNAETKRIRAGLELEKMRQQTLRAEASLMRARAEQERTEIRLNNSRKKSFSEIRQTPKYQLGRGFYSAGSYLGKNLSAPAANILGTGFQLVGTTLMNPSMGAMVAVSQLVKGITELGKTSLEAYSNIESLKTNLGIVFSSKTQAESAFRDLSKYAIKSPFGVSETTELAVLLRQSGVKESDLMSTLTMLGDTAGGNMEK